MNKTSISLISIVLALYCLPFMWSVVNAQDKTVTWLYDPSSAIPDRDIELIHLSADLAIRPYDTLVTGKVKFRFRFFREDVDSAVFSFSAVDLKTLEMDGESVDHRVTGSGIVVYFYQQPEKKPEHELFFDYTVKPTEGLYFIGWNDPAGIKRKQIWAHRPDRWLPYLPAILTTDMNITVDGDLKVMTNGIRTKVTDNKDGTKSWHYQMSHPHPFFSTCLVIGEYEFKNFTTERGLPYELWYYPDQEDHFEPTYRYQAEMLDFFEKEFGFSYPWELYRQAPVIDYLYGAMETTTSTVFGDYLMVDERSFYGRNYINVNAHELAHQWFGNYVSHLKTRDVWLTESFATYWAKKFEESVFGEDHYQHIRHLELMDTYQAAKRNSYPVGHSWGGRDRFYPKGSLVLDMLRDVMGDEDFRAAIRYYLEQHPYTTAETNDFLQAIRATTGRSMEWFFDEWIYRGGEPSYKVGYEQVINAAGMQEFRIMVEQVHETNDLVGLFKMPVNVEVYFRDGSVLQKKQWIEKRNEQIVIENPEQKEVDFVIFDPNRRIIKTLDFKRSYQELAAQAHKARNMIDRYDALVALRDIPVAIKKKDLLEIYHNETFHLTKAEIIAQLSAEPDEEILALFGQALNDPDDKARLAVVQNLELIPPVLKEDCIKILKDESYFNVGEALVKLCASFPDETQTFLELTENETGWRGRNIRMAWLEIALSHGMTDHTAELKNYCGPSYEFETRINAMDALKRLNLLDEFIVNNLLEGYLHWNYKIRNAAEANLLDYYKQNDHKLLIDRCIMNAIWSSDQKRRIEKLFST